MSPLTLIDGRTSPRAPSRERSRRSRGRSASKSGKLVIPHGFRIESLDIASVVTVVRSLGEVTRWKT